jgi:hypothetical protein
VEESLSRLRQQMLLAGIEPLDDEHLVPKCIRRALASLAWRSWVTTNGEGSPCRITKPESQTCGSGISETHRAGSLDLAAGVWGTLIISDFFNVENVTDVSILEQAALAGVAAVLALIKGLVATKVGSPYTAATLPAKAETPDP